MIILNPEPERAWDTGDSVVHHYRDTGAEVHHVDTIRDLAELVYRF
ncbi:MAG: hypothetical protein ACTSP4_05320 [Candidatus Hodarchaeales archaeon]